jgi:D-glycerate 3-kinase
MAVSIVKGACRGCIGRTGLPDFSLLIVGREISRSSSISLEVSALSLTFDPRYKALLAHWLETLSPKMGISKTNPLLFGVSGSQGSGKSSLARYLAQEFGLAYFSLDDVYLTKLRRLDLSRDIHPLFATRGPPLTHDLDLASQTIESLSTANTEDLTPIPTFDKLIDDRAPRSLWPVFKGRPRAIIVEGWCLGAKPISPAVLTLPINNLERDFDAQGVWRTRWNDALSKSYQDFFATFDAILYLEAPSFDVVLDWRCEQEETLLGMTKGTLPVHNRIELAKFQLYFERLTRHMLGGGVVSSAIAKLDRNRQTQSIQPL